MAPFLLDLHPQNAILFEFFAVYSMGSMSVPMWESSQKGCVELRLQAHHLYDFPSSTST
jgi:hypothetical protein